MRLKLYHGTKTEHVESIMKGVDLDKIGETDAGDFGWGLYLTSSYHRAKQYGNAVLEVVINDIKLAYIPQPYFIQGFKNIDPKTREEQVFFDLAFDNNRNMKTCYQGSKDRVKTSKKIAMKFIEMGYTGIKSDYGSDGTVVFDPSIIISIKVVK